MRSLVLAIAIALPTPAFAAAQEVRAAGMPLQDGALPPGSLTVRVVRGSFSADLPGVTVNLDLDGRGTRSQVTGAQGRAEFAHLPVGVKVRAWAVVGNERLESDTFEVPGDSGRRVLLIAGADVGDGATAHAAPAAVPAAETAGNDMDGATIVRVLVTSATVFAFALVGVQVWRNRRSAG